jgi:4-amino-4-deoxy-L-arabinose transferase-like glycosyltransferase
VLVSLLILIASAWAFGALWFDCSVAAETHAAAFAYLGVLLLMAVLSITWRWWRRSAVFVAAVLAALVALWWSFLEPSNHHDWQTDVSREQ